MARLDCPIAHVKRRSAAEVTNQLPVATQAIAAILDGKARFAGRASCEFGRIAQTQLAAR